MDDLAANGFEETLAEHGIALHTDSAAWWLLLTLHVTLVSIVSAIRVTRSEVTGLTHRSSHSAPCYGLIKAPATQCDRTSQTCLFSTTRCRCLSPCMPSSSCNPIRPQYAISLSRRFLASNIISIQRGLCTFLLSARLPQSESHPLSTLQNLKQAHLKAHVAAPTSDAVLSLERNCPISRVNHLLLCLA